MIAHRIARPRVDREEELALIVRLACGETATRIALIRAESGMGKSELLYEFRARCPNDLSVIFVDFKGGGLSLADLLFHICDTLGWSCFPTLTRTIQGMMQPAQINITGNMLIGQNEIAILLAELDEQTRELRQSRLTTALIDDLRTLGRVALVLDVFEKCAPQLQAWFSSVFLPAAHRSPQLAVIVAGQHTPEPSQMWEAESLKLAEIAPEHWQEYAHAVGASVTLEFIRGCCAALKGHCLGIAQVIDSQGSRRA